MKDNYFEEVNPNWRTSEFKLDDREDPDMKSQKLITDLANTFCDNKKTPSGNILSVKNIERTRDQRERWYAKVQVHDDSQNYIATFGVTADYIGASVNRAQKAGISQAEILDHIAISRTLEGHLLFPTWYSTKDGTSWNGNDKNDNKISINIARCSKYFDRIDGTLWALKQWYSSASEETKLSAVIKKNRLWFELFCSFDEFIKYFKLESLLTENGDIVDLTSFDPNNNTFSAIITDESKIRLPQDSHYKNYIEGCNFFISSRVL